VLPALNGDGLLPKGRHRADLAEIESVFVLSAPYQRERQLVFEALRLYVRLVQRILPSGSLWIDGGFVTHKRWEAPHDVDVCIALDEGQRQAAPPSAAIDLQDLITHLDVIERDGAGGGVIHPRLQPMGGLVDGFLVDLDDPVNVAYWERLWSSVMGPGRVPIDGAVKGYVEVAW
jgi:hypothetical protein